MVNDLLYKSPDNFLSQNLSEAVDEALTIQDSAKKDRKVR